MLAFVIKERGKSNVHRHKYNYYNCKCYGSDYFDRRACYKWFSRQNKQDEDIKVMKSELCLLTYGLLACLKGLKEQGCNGPVTEAIDKIEKRINKQAHEQE